MTTLPCPGWVTAVIVRVSGGSGKDVSLASTSRLVPGEFSATWKVVSLTAFGGALTRMVTSWVADVSTPPCAVPPSSLTWRVRWAVPDWPVAGGKVSVPDAETAGPAENSAELSSLGNENVRAWPDSFAGPVDRPVAQPVAL